MSNERSAPISWKEWWKDLIKTLIWAGVTLFGLWWVGKPLAEGMSHRTTMANPNEFLKALFSFPTAILLIFLFVGIQRWKSLVTVITKAIAEGKVESIASVKFYPPRSVPTPTLPQTSAATPTKEVAPAEPLQIPTNKENV